MFKEILFWAFGNEDIGASLLFCWGVCESFALFVVLGIFIPNIFPGDLLNDQPKKPTPPIIIKINKNTKIPFNTFINSTPP